MGGGDQHRDRARRGLNGFQVRSQRTAPRRRECRSSFFGLSGVENVNPSGRTPRESSPESRHGIYDSQRMGNPAFLGYGAAGEMRHDENRRVASASCGGRADGIERRISWGRLVRWGLEVERSKASWRALVFDRPLPDHHPFAAGGNEPAQGPFVTVASLPHPS